LRDGASDGFDALLLIWRQGKQCDARDQVANSQKVVAKKGGDEFAIVFTSGN
jgi:hypothetical protein